MIAMYYSGFQALYIEYFDDYKLIKTIFWIIYDDYIVDFCINMTIINWLRRFLD